MDTRFDRIEQLINNNNNNGQQTQTNANPTQNNSRQFGNGQRVQYQNAYRGNRGTQPVQSTQNAGGGYVCGSAQPGPFQTQTQSGNFQAKAEAPNASYPPPARGGAVVAPDPGAATVEDDDEETQIKQATGWWSPNMLTKEVAGYEEDCGNLSYGLEGFQQQ